MGDSKKVRRILNGVLWHLHGYKVLAFDEANVDRCDGEIGNAAGDLAHGIVDLCSQFRQRHAEDYALEELSEIVERALKRASSIERTAR